MATESQSLALVADSPNPEPLQPFLVSVDKAAELLSIGRTMVYALMERGELAYRMVGNCRRIPVSELQRFSESDWRT
jgi:excisionase family DNA binding protein